jgi:hypothetical protein
MNDYVMRLIKQRKNRLEIEMQAEQSAIDAYELQAAEARGRRAALVAEHESLLAELAAGKPEGVAA